MERRQDSVTSTTTLYQYTTISTTTVTFTSTLPLSSAFTPSSRCLAPTITLKPGGFDSVSTLYGRGAGGMDAPYTIPYDIRGADPVCFPSGYTLQVLARDLPTGTYSPIVAASTQPTQPGIATVITSGYYTSYTSLSASEIYFSPALCPASYMPAYQSSLTGEWKVTCCPEPVTSFSIDGARECFATGGPPLTVINGSSTMTASGAYTVASPVFVAYNDAQSTSLQSAAMTGTRQSQSSTVTTSPTSTNRPNGLSTGAQAGIGVGVALGVLLLLLGAFLVWRRRKGKTTAGTGPPDENHDKAELPGETKPMAELDPKATQLSESGGLAKPPEMDSSNVRAELEGDWRGWEAPAQAHR